MIRTSHNVAAWIWANFSVSVEDIAPDDSITIPRVVLPLFTNRIDGTPMSLNFSTARFLSFLLPWRTSHIVEQVAGEVARECRSGLWQRVYQRTANMSLAESRGYLRALAVGCVDNEVEQAICRRHLRTDLRSRLVDASVDQLINMVAHAVLTGEPPARVKTMAA
jgi:hypothetical protein